MKKTLLLILSLLVIGVLGCKSRAPATEDFDPPILTEKPIIPPTPTSLPDDVQARVKEELTWALDNIAFIEQEAPDGEIVRYYRLIGLSAGKTYSIELNEYRLDVLDIYLMMIPGPINVPLVVGFEDAQGHYTSLVADQQELSREQLLEHIATLYPSWQRIQIMLAGNFVTAAGVDWEACTDNQPALQLTLDGYCEIGKTLEDVYPSEMQLLRIQALYRTSKGFALPWLLMPPMQEIEPPPTISPSEIDELLLSTPGE